MMELYLRIRIKKIALICITVLFFMATSIAKILHIVCVISTDNLL